MKLPSLLFMSAFVATKMFAGNTEEVNSLRAVAFDGRDLKFEYVVAGGCEVHEGQVQVNLVGTPIDYVAVVKVYDFEPIDDSCQSYIAVKGQVDLHSKILEAAITQGIDPKQLVGIPVRLPLVNSTGPFKSHR